MQNLTRAVWIKCEAQEDAVNLTLKGGHTQGECSSRGGLCQEDKERKEFKVEESKAEPEKGWQFPELLNILVYSEQMENGDKTNNIGVEVKVPAGNVKELKKFRGNNCLSKKLISPYLCLNFLVFLPKPWHLIMVSSPTFRLQCP